EAEHVVSRLLGIGVDVREGGGPLRSRRVRLIELNLGRLIPRLLGSREEGWAEPEVRGRGRAEVAAPVRVLDAARPGELVPAVDAHVPDGRAEGAEVVAQAGAPLIGGRRLRVVVQEEDLRGREAVGDQVVQTGHAQIGRIPLDSGVAVLRAPILGEPDLVYG